LHNKLDLEEFNSKNTRLLIKEDIKDILSKEGWLSKEGESKNGYYGYKLSDEELKNVFKSEGWQEEKRIWRRF